MAVVLAAGLLLVDGVIGIRPASATATTFAGRMLELINQDRAGVGAPAVEASAALAGVAQDAPYQGCGFPVAGRSADMGARNYFSHVILNCGSQGASDELQASGTTYAAIGENIAWVSGMTDPVLAAERLNNDLMADDGHRANILNPAFTDVGVGSWHTATGQSWSGGGSALPNVFLTTNIFAQNPGTTAVPAGSLYHPLSPARILDTRNGPGPLGPSATMNLQATGVGGVPASGVGAVVMNLTVTGPTAPSYLTVFPAGGTMATVSSINFSAGQTVGNLVTATVGIGGEVSIYNSAGATHVIADVAGWFDDGTATTGSRYHPLSPARILDTRNGPGPLGPSATMNLQATGVGGVPASGVGAVVMNLTVTGPTAPSYLTVFPAGGTMATVSSINFSAGQTVGNLVTATVGTGGQVSIYNSAGATHVIADVAGWFDAG